MTEAPRIKKALDRLRRIAFKTNSDIDKKIYYGALSKAYQNGDLVPATFQPAGEGREAIARLIDDLLQADCDYENAPKWDEKSKYEALKAARHSLDAAIDNALASGLVQDEAGIRADEREKCAKLAESCHGVDEGDLPSDVRAGNRIAVAIRSARDGGAET